MYVGNALRGYMCKTSRNEIIETCVILTSVKHYTSTIRLVIQFESVDFTKKHNEKLRYFCIVPNIILKL